MKNVYESPELEIYLMDVADVITTSDYWGDGTDGDDWENGLGL